MEIIYPSKWWRSLDPGFWTHVLNWLAMLIIINYIWIIFVVCISSFGHLKKAFNSVNTTFFFSGLLHCSFSSVQFSRSVVSDSLQPHESQHARPPCPSPNPGVHSDSRPSSLWCHLAISSSVVPFFSCPQSLPASKSFPMSQLFAWSLVLEYFLRSDTQ